jgi:hypothetical protein
VTARRRERTRRGAVGVGAVLASACASGCAPSRTLPAAAGEGPLLVVPHAATPVMLDGDNDDPAWHASPGPARTGAFVRASGLPTRPYSDARLLWGDGFLYVLLYAADEDITRDDAFRMRFARGEVEYAIVVTAAGVVQDAARNGRGLVGDRGLVGPVGPAIVADRSPGPRWQSGTHVSRELDGTPDDARDIDEEWSLEIAVPFESIGMRGERGESAGFAVDRCDASSAGSGACGGWGEARPGGGGGGRFVIE